MVTLTWICVTSISTYERYRYQTEDGRYFAYQQGDGQFHIGNWTIDGIARGAFGWFDKEGIETALEFIADDRGYRIIRRRNFTRINLGNNNKGIPIEEDSGDTEHSVIAYAFKYITGSTFRVEQKRKTGLIYGKYGFIDGIGRLIIMHYTAHKNRGFLPLREVFDPSRGQLLKIGDAYKLPLRDVAAEYGLKEYYRSARP